MCMEISSSTPHCLMSMTIDSLKEGKMPQHCRRGDFIWNKEDNICKVTLTYK